MEHAKRMLLIDERFLERLREPNWQKPIEQTAKTKLVREMKNRLNEDEIADDLQVKNYNRDLIRFLNVKRTLPEQAALFEPKPQAEPEPAAPKPEPAAPKREEPKPKVRKASVQLYKPRPKRLKRPPKKFDWIEW